MILPVTVFLAAVAYLPGVGSATTAGRWAVLALGAAILLVRAHPPWNPGPGHALGAALLAWAALGTTWSVSPLDTLGELWHWTVLAILFAAGARHRNAEWTLSALVLGLCASVPFVLLQIRGLEPVAQVWNPPAGLFLNRNVMGEIAACALVWAVASRTWIFVPVLLFLVISSGSRGAMLACLFGAFYWLWHTGRRWWIVPIVACFAVGVAYFAYGTTRADSLYARLDIWTMAAINLTWFGRGLETFGTLAPLYEFVHNDLLQITFELGVPGAVLSVALLGRSLGGRLPTPEGAALASLVGASLVSYPLHHPMGAALVAVLAGYTCGARDRARRSESLLRDCGTARSAYESEPVAGLRRPRFGGRMVPV